MTTLTTIPELIRALGGPTAVARWAGYEDARGVCNWLSRGIPPAYHMRLALEAARRGCVIDGAVFELEESDAETWRAIAAAAVPAARASASAGA